MIDVMRISILGLVFFMGLLGCEKETDKVDNFLDGLRRISIMILRFSMNLILIFMVNGNYMEYQVDCMAVDMNSPLIS